MVCSGAPFQKTMASLPKLSPLTVTLKGTLLTGTLFGVRTVIEGGDQETPRCSDRGCRIQRRIRSQTELAAN
jgi:hypothetical protein